MNNKINIKESGFTTPKNYFDGVEDTVFAKINASQEFNDIQDTGFSVPDDYFDTVEDRVFDQLNSTTKVVSLLNRRHLLYISGIAASVLILLSIFVKRTKAIDQELDYDLVESYLIDQNLSSYEIASLLTEEELSNLSFEIMDEAFNDEEMQDYLLENANLEDIIEQ